MDENNGNRAIRYHSFILSVWVETGPFPGSPPVWRMSLENPRTSERHGFKDLADMVVFLNNWLAAPPAEKYFPDTEQ